MNWKVGLLSVFVIAVGALIWWRINQGQDCSALSRQRTAGIDFALTINKVKSIQSTLGVTDKDVKELDDLLRDYEAKYENICRDYSKLHVITAGEYNCRRDNMDRTLDNVRALREVLDKTSENTTNELAKKYISSILDASRTGFKNGCGATLRISPDKFRIAKEINHVITVINIGNREVNFGVTQVPQCLLPDPRTGKIEAGESRDITLWRTYYPVLSDSFTLMIDDNFDNHHPVEVSGATNLPTPQELGAEIRSTLKRVPTLEDAIHFVMSNSKKTTGAADQNIPGGAYVTAAAILAGAGNLKDSAKAFEIAEKTDPMIGYSPSIQFERGVVSASLGEYQSALNLFYMAQIGDDWKLASKSRFFYGLALVQDGKPSEAATYFCGLRGPADATGLRYAINYGFPDEGPGVESSIKRQWQELVHVLDKVQWQRLQLSPNCKDEMSTALVRDYLHSQTNRN
jgi:hypothetical protein